MLLTRYDSFLPKNKTVGLVVLFTGLTIAFVFAKDKPFHKTYALSPKQVLANWDSLNGKNFLTTGYMEPSDKGWLRIRGRTGKALVLRSAIKAPPVDNEVIIRAQLIKNNLFAKQIYTYQGLTSNRVIFSLFPIPFIIYAFFKEFKFKDGLFRPRKNYDLD